MRDGLEVPRFMRYLFDDEPERLVRRPWYAPLSLGHRRRERERSEVVARRREELYGRARALSDEIYRQRLSGRSPELTLRGEALEGFERLLGELGSAEGVSDGALRRLLTVAEHGEWPQGSA